MDWKDDDGSAADMLGIGQDTALAASLVLENMPLTSGWSTRIYSPKHNSPSSSDDLNFAFASWNYRLKNIEENNGCF